MNWFYISTKAYNLQKPVSHLNCLSDWIAVFLNICKCINLLNPKYLRNVGWLPIRDRYIFLLCVNPSRLLTPRYPPLLQTTALYIPIYGRNELSLSYHSSVPSCPAPIDKGCRALCKYGHLPPVEYNRRCRIQNTEQREQYCLMQRAREHETIKTFGTWKQTRQRR